MSGKPVLLREQAAQDVDDAISFLLKEHARERALDFIDALERAYGLVGRHPGAGSTRYGHDLDLRGPRTVPVSGFPYLVFYVERDDYVDVWRVLHTKRDIPSSFASRE
ncbi:type II toxin-antitoxin system RelE/ParE family toxin [Jiangella rhizosphaerae]|uniref:Type II toxin-antitoxin system RelE/ParE family toxin n=1 Tax=Jiangella rhizosphaerae TaxID=2293569 RepID=A0A418KRG2_9ACTN|nr:type II toxin-antitoxin system RelE/ParE family toxin [Jiangella rhizosphaerae]RIQ25058.1 type II toxin-antitoxin system RelE/ParE family toxin [Jiangella rhizosphaerae]